MERISQDFSDYGLRNDKSTIFHPHENDGLRALCSELIYPIENKRYF